MHSKSLPLLIHTLVLSAVSHQDPTLTTSLSRIQVTGSGTNSGSNTVSFPGAYSSSHPGITIGIYDNSGNPLNGGRPYQIPGPQVLTCSGNSNGGDSPPTTLTTSRVTTPTQAPGTGAPLYGQCGGEGWTGATTCVSGTCKATNQWYSKFQPQTTKPASSRRGVLPANCDVGQCLP